MQLTRSCLSSANSGCLQHRYVAVWDGPIIGYARCELCSPPGDLLHRYWRYSEWKTEPFLEICSAFYIEKVANKLWPLASAVERANDVGRLQTSPQKLDPRVMQCL